MCALYTASSDGDIDAVRQLVRSGEDVDRVDRASDYESPLIIAAASGTVTIVNLPLEANANVDAGLHGRGSAILHACLAGHVDVVNALVAAGADLRSDQPGHNNNNSLLDLACEIGQTAIVKLLLDAGVPSDRPLLERSEHHYSPLYKAAMKGYPDIVDILLARGADVDGYDLATPLYAATCCRLVDYFG